MVVQGKLLSAMNSSEFTSHWWRSRSTFSLHIYCVVCTYEWRVIEHFFTTYLYAACFCLHKISGLSGVGNYQRRMSWIFYLNVLVTVRSAMAQFRHCTAAVAAKWWCLTWYFFADTVQTKVQAAVMSTPHCDIEFCTEYVITMVV